MSLAIAEGRAVDDLDAIQADLVKRGVEFSMGTYVDVHGVTKAKLVPVESFARMCRGSELYTVGALDGMGDLGPEEDECSASRFFTFRSASLPRKFNRNRSPRSS